MKRKTAVRKDEITRILLCSDPHGGSTAGLMPPEFELLDGTVIGQNPYQKWLWANWIHALGEWYPSLPPPVGRTALVLNGDATEGDHHRTVEIFSRVMADHIRCAVSCFEPFMSLFDDVFVIKGTECHTHDLEHAVARELGARSLGAGRYARDFLAISIGGSPGIIRHHIGTSARPWTEGTAPIAALNQERIEAVRTGSVPPMWIARAHRHRHGIYSDGGRGMAIVTGAWQGETRHVHKVVPAARSIPSIVVLDAPAGHPAGRLPVTHETTYEPEAIRYENT